MALVFCDGFDHYASINADPVLLYTADQQLWQKWEEGWDQGDGTIEAQDYWQRRPDPSSWPIGYFVCNSVWYPYWMYRHFNEDHYDTLIVGFAFLGYPGFNQPQSPIVTFYNYDNDQIAQITPIDGNGRVTMTAGPQYSLLQTFYSDTNVTEEYTWYHCEAKWVFDDSTSGSMECRINEVTVINQTGIQTYKSGGDSEGNYSISEVKVEKGLHNTFFLDDFYILDGEGSVANDFIGDSRIDTLFPEANGDYAQFTPSAGSNYECVEPKIWSIYDYPDVPIIRAFRCNVTGADFSRYNESETVGHRDCYNHQSILSLGKPIHAIQQNSNFRKTDAGKKQVEQFLRVSSTNYDTGNIIEVPDFSRNYYWPWTVNPNTSVAWTESDINALQSGLEIVY